MHRMMMLAVVLLFPPLPALGQFSPYAPPVQGNTDPRTRRALRERAVAYAGASSRDLVETHGEPAVAALFACSRAGARKLVEFSNSGGLARLPRPVDLLHVTAQRGHGDDVALYAIRHVNELTDVDAFNAYLQSPLEYTCGLRFLEEGAAEARARRLSGQAAAAAQAAARPWQVTLDGRAIALGGGVLAIAVLLLWWKRNRPLT